MPRFPAWTATRRIALAIGASTLVAGFSGAASAQTKLKMVLNWKYQGPQGFFFVAEDKGYFKAEGLDVAIDQGDGSATPIPKVASGTYDVGFGDINALIDFAVEAPGGGADRGLCDVQPAALHGRGEGRQPDQDAEGLRGPHDRRCGE